MMTMIRLCVLVVFVGCSEFRENGKPVERGRKVRYQDIDCTLVENYANGRIKLHYKNVFGEIKSVEVSKELVEIVE